MDFYIQGIYDESGSMSIIRKAMEAAINGFLDNQKAENDSVVTITYFSGYRNNVEFGGPVMQPLPFKPQPVPQFPDPNSPYTLGGGQVVNAGPYITQTPATVEPAVLRTTRSYDGMEYRQPFTCVPIKDVPKIEINPTNNTALYDAICRRIDELGQELAAMPEHERPKKVVVMIVTDGQENASRVNTLADVRRRIEHQRDKYGWEFIFYGAEEASMREATNMGIQLCSMTKYDATEDGTRHITLDASSKFSSYRAQMKGTPNA
jgi:hypothetical protein